jgi:hypothetical protein
MSAVNGTWMERKFYGFVRFIIPKLMINLQLINRQ